MLQFWCLSPVRVAYHGSFRENLESAFWGLGLSYHNLIKHMRVFKREQLKCCSFDASPQSEWLITAHLERIWSQHFGALGCHITTWLSTCKSSKAEQLKCCSFDASPQSEWLITAHLERIWSQHFGALGCHITTWLIKHMLQFWVSPVRITAHLEQNLSQHALGSHIWLSTSKSPGAVEMLQFWCLSPVRVAYHGSFRENLESAFWCLRVSYRSLIRQMHVFFKRAPLKCCSFVPLPSQSGLSRLI